MTRGGECGWWAELARRPPRGATRDMAVGALLLPVGRWISRVRTASWPGPPIKPAARNRKTPWNFQRKHFDGIIPVEVNVE
ncbi:MAG: hypothetical protein O7G88_08635 [bacterium]|nr:hypothetical protein [bacterium]